MISALAVPSLDASDVVESLSFNTRGENFAPVINSAWQLEWHALE